MSSTSITGCTTVPKVNMSYKWIIRDAVTLTTHQSDFRSPPFSILLPGCGQISWWHLYCHSFGSTSPINIHLCHGKHKETGALPKQPSILISDIFFSVLNESGESLFSKSLYNTLPYLSVDIDHKVRSYSLCSLERINVKKYIVNDTISFQIKATLHGPNNPIGTVVSDDEIHVPPDNTGGKMHEFYKRGAFTDMTIVCAERKFKVHRVILALQSAVFKTMLESDMEEKKSGIINIPDIPPAVMDDVVSYLYTGVAPNINTLTKELLTVADKYELHRLFAMCQKELKSALDVTNVVDTLILADLHSAVELKKACLTFIHLNSAKVHATSAWKSLKEDHCMLMMEFLEFSMQFK